LKHAITTYIPIKTDETHDVDTIDLAALLLLSAIFERINGVKLRLTEELLGS
jgi:predicted transcriptional regulator